MNSVEIHREILEDVREDLRKAEEVLRGAQERLNELRAVERYHAGKVGGSEKTPGGSSMSYDKFFDTSDLDDDEGHPSLSIRGKMRHEAAEMVLREAGKPMQIPAITDRLEELDYEPKTERKKLANALYTAMIRKEETFTKRGTEWGLKEWDQEVIERATSEM